MRAYTRLTTQRRFSFRTEHHEPNTSLYDQVFSRILDQWSSRCSAGTAYEETVQRYGLLCGVPRCSEERHLAPDKTELPCRKPDLCQIWSPLLFKIFSTWHPAEVTFLADLCSSQDGRLRVA
jgi:hypothetical protein